MALHVAFVINNMSGGGAALSCINLMHMLLLRKNFKIDLVLLEYKGSRLTQIPEAVSLFVLDAKFHKKKTLPCSIPFEKIQWLKPPSSLIKRLSTFRRYYNSLTCSGGMRLKAKKRHRYWATVLTEYIGSEQPDVLYAHLNHAGVMSVLSRRMSSINVPVIWTVHNNPEFCLGDKSIFQYFVNLLGDADRIHAVSKGVAGKIKQLVPTTKDKITIMHNPLKSNVESLSLAKVEHPWLISRQNDSKVTEECISDSKIVLGVGSLSIQKNFSVLIQALAVVRQNYNARLIILGDGYRRRALEEMARSLDIEHAVSLPGWLPNPYAYMSKADVFVLSSKYEGFGNVVLEALACGCPVVSTDCPYGPSEILEGGRWGRLVPVGDHIAMADAISASFEENICDKLLRNRAHAFAPEKISEQLVELLKVTVINSEHNS